MRLLVLGGDGYLGWPTSMYLSSNGHEVAIVDSMVRRHYDEELQTSSLNPIASLDQRVRTWHALSGKDIHVYQGDICHPGFISGVISDFRPDSVIHFAEQRSAPYSMIDEAHAVYTQESNVVGTLRLLYALAAHREVHLVKLGTMGEYGTPNIDIEEGWITVRHNGREDRMLFPKRPGSMYHLSKVHDSHNIEFACRTWGLAATDLNQGVVYGTTTPETSLHTDLATRFDYDGIFGTVLNRFITQAVLGIPLTIYGSGRQVRGFIDIRDTVECIRIACEKPARAGEFRVFNQMTESFSIQQISDLVVGTASQPVTVRHLDNPRVESEDHYYNVSHSRLEDIGLRPHRLCTETISSLLNHAEQLKDRIDPTCIEPVTQWRSLAE